MNENKMLRNALNVFLSTCLILLSSLATAQVEPGRLDAIVEELQTRIEQQSLSGAVVMVAQDDEILMREALGERDVENGRPMTMDTIFRIFSMTKPIAGTALMMLHDEGEFELDDPVARYLPELQGLEVFESQNEDGSFNTVPADHPMTIRELMSHTGGLVYTPPLSSGPIAQAYTEAGLLDRDSTLEQMVESLGEIPLGYQPGSEWVYSISVDVQGALVEALSGQSFDEFLQERIFEPLDMDDTAFYVEESKADRLARQYMPGDNGLTRTDTGEFLEEPTLFSGGGGLTSTAGDYMRFARMHLNKGELDGTRILSEEAVEIMRSNQLPEDVDRIAGLYPGNVFGVDFAIVEDSEAFNGAPEGTHWWWGIAGSWFWIDPVRDIVFVGMIQNDDLGSSLQLHSRMRELIYQPL